MGIMNSVVSQAGIIIVVLEFRVWGSLIDTKVWSKTESELGFSKEKAKIIKAKNKIGEN